MKLSRILSTEKCFLIILTILFAFHVSPLITAKISFSVTFHKDAMEEKRIFFIEKVFSIFKKLSLVNFHKFFFSFFFLVHFCCLNSLNSSFRSCENHKSLLECFESVNQRLKRLRILRFNKCLREKWKTLLKIRWKVLLLCVNFVIFFSPLALISPRVDFCRFLRLLALCFRKTSFSI